MVKHSSENGAKKALQGVSFHIHKKKTSDNSLIITRLSRAENGTRTRDLNLGKVALYQLSYFRKMCDLLSEIAFAKIDKKNGFPNSERQKIRFFVILGCTSDVVCW